MGAVESPGGEEVWVLGPGRPWWGGWGGPGLGVNQPLPITLPSLLAPHLSPRGQVDPEEDGGRGAVVNWRGQDLWERRGGG